MATKAPVIYTVSEITQAIKSTLEKGFPLLSLQGEISNFRHQSSGHLYFSLKDENAQIAAVMFRGQANKLAQIPKDGDQVIVKATLTVYPPRGNYQILVQELSLAGIGQLLLELEKRKVALHKKGYFKKEHKQIIPKDPERLVIITSPTGAAIQDMLTILSRRQSGMNIYLYPVKVQGEDAASEIALAIHEVNQYKLADVMIVGRGGGSVEDLWAFNELCVAEAIFQSQIPIIGAVGHETDHCIAEYVADLRAPTPSAAAELVTNEKGEQREKCEVIRRSLDHTIFHFLARQKETIKHLQQHPIFFRSSAILAPFLQRIDELRDKLDWTIQQKTVQKKELLKGLKKMHLALNPIKKITEQKRHLQSIHTALTTNICHHIQVLKQKTSYIKTTLEAVNPRSLLAKGYSIAFSEKDGSVISSVESVDKGDLIKILVANGSIQTKVQHTNDQT